MSVEKLSASFAPFGFSIPLPAVGHVFSGFEYLGGDPGHRDSLRHLRSGGSARQRGERADGGRQLPDHPRAYRRRGREPDRLPDGQPVHQRGVHRAPGLEGEGGRIGYSAATGITVIVLSWFGVISLISTIIPVIAISPILLYIGMLIGAQAFQETPRAHAPAIVLALTPNLAAWGKLLIDNALPSSLASSP
jgi:AGZA family xanthine/uracil permease-like MFS transporter